MGILDLLWRKPQATSRPTRVFSSRIRSVDVVGGSHYQAAIWRIVGPAEDDDGPTWSGQARLIPDPTNRYDSNAVKVTIDNRCVGHLDRELASRLHSALARISTREQVDVAVPAEVKGGFRFPGGSGRASLGVVLRFDPKAIIAAGSGQLVAEPGYYKGKHYTEYVDEVGDLKRAGRLDDAVALLLALVDAVEAEGRVKNYAPAPWYYEQLAIVYRKLKNNQAEIEVLERYGERFAKHCQKGNPFAERLEKARVLREGHTSPRVIPRRAGHRKTDG